ncbi:hypothetical protein EIN_375600 [Entamoeba invadens IP1]|uniref:Uncharacterized protein n=1 Tax=Entamoeba invadens IP1 TaxID=370355 RepID=A0A0A1TU56_ENTIV|nr:hypothetical protein EIN_375600 [Entamoeba invadens IP1]ELP83445.1 hypothetical protein EIN_375600 [Entamoeba invadens IP1]|eukprot:XP_004182791.1 hypothetical protein EIN_375600 [Entamoeba invadens IP1]
MQLAHQLILMDSTINFPTPQRSYFTQSLNTFNFSSAPNPIPSPLKNLSPTLDINTNCFLVQTPQNTGTPMEEDDIENDQVFDLDDEEELSDDSESCENTETNYLAQQIVDTMNNITRQSEETNKMLKNIVSLNSPTQI